MRALIVGYYGYGNAGDEALLHCLLQQLPADIEPVVLSQDPVATARTYAEFGIQSCSRRDGLKLWQQAQNVDALIWGGGGLIQDATSWRSPLYYLGLMGLAQSKGSRTVAWAQGIGPLQRNWIQFLARRGFGGCSGVSVRDVGSAALLQNWGIPYLLAPDPVWALDPQPLEWGQAGADLELAPSRIAVVLRDHPQLTPERVGVLTQALAQLQQLTGSQILLLPFQLGADPQDPSADQRLALTMAADLSQAHVLPIADPQRLRGLFEGVSWALVMRFHGLVMAAAAGCRCFGLSYDPKVSFLLAELGFPGWRLPEIPADPDQIVPVWLEHFQRGPHLSLDQRSQWRERAGQHRQILAQALT